MLVRLKSDIPLRRTSEILPDGSYRAELSGDGRRFQRPERRVAHRAALGTDLPVPLHLRLRDRHHLAEHHVIAGADLLRAADDQRGPVGPAQVPAALQRRGQQLQRHRDDHPGRNGHGARRDRVRKHARLLLRSGI